MANTSAFFKARYERALGFWQRKESHLSVPMLRELTLEPETPAGYRALSYLLLALTSEEDDEQILYHGTMAERSLGEMARKWPENRTHQNLWKISRRVLTDIRLDLDIDVPVKLPEEYAREAAEIKEKEKNENAATTFREPLPYRIIPSEQHSVSDIEDSKNEQVVEVAKAEELDKDKALMDADSATVNDLSGVAQPARARLRLDTTVGRHFEIPSVTSSLGSPEALGMWDDSPETSHPGAAGKRIREAVSPVSDAGESIKASKTPVLVISAAVEDNKDEDVATVTSVSQEAVEKDNRDEDVVTATAVSQEAAERRMQTVRSLKKKGKAPPRYLWDAFTK